MKSVQLKRMQKSGLEKCFKLESTMSLSNMHAFDHNNNIQKYSTPDEIVESYFPVRLGLYHDRKNVLECSKEYETAIIRNKARFIENVVDGNIDLIKGGKTKQDTILQLLQEDYDQISDLQKILKRKEKYETKEDSTLSDDEKSKQYDYLLNMPLSSLTADKVESLITDAEKTEKELRAIKDATPASLWHHDLDKLEAALKKIS